MSTNAPLIQAGVEAQPKPKILEPNLDKLAPEQKDPAKRISKSLQIFKASSGLVRPHFFVTGPSGAGKNHCIRALCKELELQCLEVNAAQITKEGMSGNSLSRVLVPLKNAGGKPCVVFVDEFDKLFINGNTNESLYNEATIGVQNEFLNILESDHASVMGQYGHYDKVPCGKVLFIFAGAFNGQEDITVDDLRGFGLKTEFIGRVGLLFSMTTLSLESMLRILQQHPLLDSYLLLYPEVKKEDVLTTLNDIITKRHENNTLGVRMLNTLIHQYFINDGKITDDEVKTTTFSKTLSFTPEAKDPTNFSFDAN